MPKARSAVRNVLTTASSAFFSWDPVTLAIGYIVWWGTVPGVPYANSLDVGNNLSTTQAALIGLGSGVRYFSVTAYDESGMIGDYATEQVITV